ncbi:undecaprenyl/decaprenyl-phosphate alpha-N-acetylglucosaminyl 1-phosphate transferase [bacterium]|nr:undecaprenyl/decaprenyl-phosphate alpha-N-acetylglucosaminyl 1-phosphate transferase [bacterium]
MKLYFEKVFEASTLQIFFALLFVSFCQSLLIILYSKYGLNRRALLDEAAVQSSHSGLVPRVGGIAVYLSILIMFPLTIVFEFEIGKVSLIVISALPIFLTGLFEDLGYPMSSKKRLIAAAVSGLLVIIFVGIWVKYLSIPGIDQVLSYAPFGIAFTLFATSGVVNAFNLIDGLNGLSSYVTISSAISLSIIAFEVGNFEITFFLFFLFAIVFGFALLNFPFGKIFLGDAGAYACGHILVWTAVLLIWFHTEISPFAILLIFFWPVADTLLAIWRRWKLGSPADVPDRLHFHQLTMRFLEIRFLGRDMRRITNPLATVILIPLISTPQVLGVLFWKHSGATILCTVTMGALFVVTYLFGINFAKKPRPLIKNEVEEN